MEKSFTVSLMVFGFWVAVGLTPVFAQEQVASDTTVLAVGVKEGARPVLGRVIGVADGVITVKEYGEYSFINDYFITTETELQDFNAVADLKVDEDDVGIDYFEKDGKRIVTSLVNYGKEEDPAPEEKAAGPVVSEVRK